MKKAVIWSTLLISLVSCGKNLNIVHPPTNTPTPDTKTDPTQTPEQLSDVSTNEAGIQTSHLLADLMPPEPFEGEELPTERGEYFAASGVCVICHKEMVDAAGNDISISIYWRGTMMANAARDPYWQAALRAETLANPDLAAIIEDTCTRCHMPMARTTVNFHGENGQAFGEGYFDPENPLHSLGMEGVSCTLCHQIEEHLLGEEASFDGGYIIDAELPYGDRVNYGPYLVSETDATIMRSGSGFSPIQGTHLQSSELCATCHTLYTPTVNGAGEVVDLFPEQMPYQEWLASAYANEVSCQDCHMPEIEGEISLSITGSPPRAPFSQHSFVGGNTYALTLLRTIGSEIQLTASSENLAAALNRAGEQLRNETAQIDISPEGGDADTLNLSIKVTNHTGHKLPTGYPSRRVWVHLMVQDINGEVIFESGGWNDDGSIIDNDNDADPLAYEPHYEMITTPDQVQIYEAVFANTDGQVTTTLLRGSEYLKDNRLLPAGFDKSTAEEEIAVKGIAGGDNNFTSGVDELQFQIPINGATGPFSVTAQLVYQSIGYRWAQKMADYDAPEPRAFMSFYERTPNLPVLIHQANIRLEP